MLPHGFVENSHRKDYSAIPFLFLLMANIKYPG